MLMIKKCHTLQKYLFHHQKLHWLTLSSLLIEEITNFIIKLWILHLKCKLSLLIKFNFCLREVKTDILDEHAVLIPNEEGRYELFLLSDNTSQLHASSSNTLTLPVCYYFFI